MMPEGIAKIDVAFRVRPVGASLFLDAFPKMIPDVFVILPTHEIGHAVRPFLTSPGVRSEVVIAFGDVADALSQPLAELPNVLNGILRIPDALFSILYFLDTRTTA
jgi:hypothetical protein